MLIQESAMQNIFSSFTRAIWQLVIGLSLLVSATFANAATNCNQSLPSFLDDFYVTEAGSVISVGVRGGCGSNVQGESIEWQITNPSPGDSVSPASALFNPPTGAQTNVQLGSAGGVRILKFCLGNGGCADPTNLILSTEIHGFATQCAPSVSNSNLSVGGSTTVKADCSAVSDNTTTIISINYSWLASPTGAPLPGQRQGTATLTFPQAGTYTYSVLPTYSVARSSNLAVTRSIATAKARLSVASITVSAPNQPPTVSITAPINPGPYTAPATIDFTATATAPGTTITSVDYLVNGVAINTTPITTPPYAFSWTNRPAGIYTVTPRVVPAVGQPVVGTGVTVTIQDPPTIAIASPANGSGGVALSPITLTANVKSNTPVTKVEYFANKISIGTAPSNVAPYTFVWTPAQPNSYDITAVVTNQVSPPVTSQAVTVLVTAPPVGSVACTVNSPSISVSEGATLTAVCTRNFRPLSGTLSADEVVRYDWVAAQAPSVPAGTTGDTLQFPAGSFAEGTYKYTVTATLTNRRFPIATTSSTEHRDGY
jgi:Bacterial Ig domain